MFTVKRNVPLAPMTTFKIGGKAEYFTEVSGALELAEALEYAENNKLPVFVFGGGSNILFSDKGFAGIVIRLQNGGLKVSGEKIIVGAGIPLFDVVKAARDAGLAGIENLAGIPGSFGGAVRGNAGAFGTEIGSVISTVKAFAQDTGLLTEYRRDECDFGYRTSLFKKRPGTIVISAELILKPGNRQELERIVEETVAKREAKHPQSASCAGSFFINPIVEDANLLEEFEKDNGEPARGGKLPAGWLIDHAGLRGKKVGGAQISDRHPNYLVNTGNATAEDVVMLASLVKQRVRDELGVQLKEEVQLVGF